MKVIKTSKILFLGACISLFFGCKENELDRTLDKMIEVSKEDGYSDYMYSFLFKEGNTAGELVYFDIDELRRLYFGKHLIALTHDLTFDMFIHDIIENRINLGCDTLGECFLIDNTISEEYSKIGFSKFKEKYSETIAITNVISLKINDLDRAEILTVIYYFYLNNYFTNWSDYDATYFSKKVLAIDVDEQQCLYLNVYLLMLQLMKVLIWNT